MELWIYPILKINGSTVQLSSISSSFFIRARCEHAVSNPGLRVPSFYGFQWIGVGERLSRYTNHGFLPPNWRLAGCGVLRKSGICVANFCIDITWEVYCFIQMDTNHRRYRYQRKNYIYHIYNIYIYMCIYRYILSLPLRVKQKHTSEHINTESVKTLYFGQCSDFPSGSLAVCKMENQEF